MLGIEKQSSYLENGISEQIACICQKKKKPERLISDITLSRPECHFKLTFLERLKTVLSLTTLQGYRYFCFFKPTLQKVMLIPFDN